MGNVGVLFFRANAAGRLAGKELLKFANDETTIAQLKDRIAKTIDYLKNIKPSEIDGTESKEITITFPSGQTRQFIGESLLLRNSLPNFLLSRYYSLRHPSAVRSRDRQARFHGHAADSIDSANGAVDIGCHFMPTGVATVFARKYRAFSGYQI